MRSLNTISYNCMGIYKYLKIKSLITHTICIVCQEAVSILENNGLLARLDGAGYVVRQSVPAGSEYTSGQLINLTLRH